MSEVYLFQLATQRTQWLHARQSLIAGNVANANTPGYSARDLVPFTAVLDSTASKMSVTNSLHMSPTDAETFAAHATDSENPDATLSGNSVNLEQEMLKLGDVSRSSNEVNAIKRAFHQMMMSAIK